jgi:hypothetical protein
MSDISRMAPGTGTQYLVNLKNKSRFLGALPKAEISPSDRREKSEKKDDKVDMSVVPSVLSKESE